MNINTKSTFLHTFMAPLGAKVLLTTALLSIATAAFAGEKVDKTIDTSSSPKVDIEHINGKADIRVWDKSQVRVTGELGDQTEEFIFERRGDVVVIHVEVERHSKSWFNKGKDGDDLVIYIPSASDLHYTAVNADLIAEGITKADSTLQSTGATTALVVSVFVIPSILYDKVNIFKLHKD